MTTEPQGDPSAPSSGDPAEAGPPDSEVDPEAVGVPVNGRVVDRDAPVDAGPDPTGAPAVGPPVASGGDGVRFPVEAAGFSGGLEQLLQLAQRGEIDLTAISVAEITGTYREGLRDTPDPREVADFLAAASRLVALKAQRILPDGGVDVEAGEEDLSAVDDPGARLAEYRLFKAAADALLAPVAEEGVRSFLGLVSAEVVPAERLAIPPERLVAAFRAVLERLPEIEPYTVAQVTFSVEEKAAHIRALLADQPGIGFEEVFAGVRSRLEAVATFLALLEMVRAGEIRVEQRHAFGDIRVRAVG